MAWLRFDKQLDLVCTEDPARNADILGTDSSIQCRKMIEIETKISISDLKNDANKSHNSRYVLSGKHDRLSKALSKERVLFKNAHRWYGEVGKEYDMVHGVEWVNEDHSNLPSQFYFLIPEDLKDKALEVVSEKYRHAGLMIGTELTCESRYFRRGYVQVIKKAPTLHKLLISKGIKSQIARRMTSEICSLRLDRMRKKWSNKESYGGSSGTDGNDRTEILSVDTPDGQGVNGRVGED